MRPQAFIGLILVLLGVFIFVRGMSYSDRDEVLKVGDVKASVETKKAVPTWAGGLAMVAGIALIVSGIKRKA
jgi:hypothetical protein